MTVNLREIQAQQKAWAEYNFPSSVLPEKFWVPLLGAGEELGELNHAALKMYQGIRGTEEEHRAAMSDAVGDLGIYMMDFCNKMGLDFGDCIAEAWLEVKQRDWIKFPKNGRTE